jgi:MFS family permease
MIGTCLVSGTLVLALWIPAANNAAVIMFAILYGFFSGAFGSMSPALVAQISPIKQIGTRVGTLFSCVALASLTGNPIGGALVGRNNGDFTYLQIFCGVAMLVGTFFFFMARWALVGFKVQKV